MTSPTGSIINRPWRASRWLPTALLVVAQALSAFAQDIQDTAGNPLAGLPYTSGATYIFAPNNPPTDLALGNSSVNQTAGANAVIGTLSTTDADSGETYTYSLVAGTGDTNNASFNISGSTLRANNASLLAGGNYSVRVQTDDGRGGTFAKPLTVTVVAAPALPAGNLVISEFRLRGPSGANDEYIEIYNPTTNAITVQAADGTPGFAVVESSGTTVFVIPNGTVIPSHGHFLGVNLTSYGLKSYPAGSGTTATGNITWTSDIPDNTGLALFQSSSTFDTGTRLDAVGFTTSPVLYREGLGLTNLTPFSIDAALYRFHLQGTNTANISDPAIALTDGEPRDTDNNVKDFAWVDSNGTLNGSNQRLGAPGPKNLSSPIASYTGTSNMVRVLIDPSASLSGTPNRVHDTISNPANNATFGTMEFNRTFTNDTGSSLTRLRFRIVKLTTFPAPSGIADLRPVTSTNGTVVTSNGTVGVNGTTLEQPPSQPNGGGWNSTFSVDSITTGTPLAAGASINLRVRFGIQQTGVYRFALLAEALPSAAHLWIVTGSTIDASREAEDGTFPNAVPTDLALSVASVNQSAGPNAVVGTLSTTDTDNGDTFTYSLVSGLGGTNNNLFNISGSQLRANNASTLPAGTYTVRVQSDDGHGGTFAEAFTITVVDDLAPIAVADTYTTGEDVELAISAPGLLVNDTDAANTNLTALLVSNPTNGSLTLNANGSFTYVPDTNFFGDDSFTYSASDGLSNSAPATVSIQIESRNDVPVGVADSYSVAEDVVLIVAAPGVLGNDTDVENNPLSASVFSGPSHGSLTLESDGSFTYTPNTNFHGADSFVYSVTDFSPKSRNVAKGLIPGSLATVTLTVTPVNDAPIAINDSYSTPEDAQLLVAAAGVLTNDIDIDGDALSAVLVSGPTNGVLTLSTNGSFTYLPNTNYFGGDSFAYYAADGLTSSAPATVTITVTARDDAPVLTTSSSNAAYFGYAGAVVVDPGLTITDLDGGTIEGATVGIGAGFASGEDSLQATNQSGITSSYSPDTGILTLLGNATAADYQAILRSVTYLNSNQDPSTNTRLMTFSLGRNIVSFSGTGHYYEFVSAAAISWPDAKTRAESMGNYGQPGYPAGVFGLQGYLVTVMSEPENAFVASKIPGIQGWLGATDEAVDGEWRWATGPEAGTQFWQGVANGSPVNGLYNNWGSGQPDSAGGEAWGQFTADGRWNDLPISYPPLIAGYVAEYGGMPGDPVLFITASRAVTVDGLNRAPVANADEFSTSEDTALIVSSEGVLANDTDVESDPLTAVLVSGPAHGSLMLSTNGTFTYLPTTNYFGSDSFTYLANDGDSNSAPATVSLTITPVDDPPVLAVNGTLNLLPASTRIITPAQLLVTDVETGPKNLIFTVTVVPTHGAVRLDGVDLPVGGMFTQADINANRVVYVSTGDASSSDSFNFAMNATDGGSIPPTSFAIAFNGIEREGEHVAGSFSISADGRYVAFQSTASNLVANDTNGVADVFVLDRYTGMTTLISVSGEGVQGNAASDWPRISADGRMVTFQSSAGNLVGDDSNNKVDVFVHDRLTAQTVRISVAPGGAQANVDSLNPAISADGRYVAFHSFANNLVAGDIANQMDVFVHNLETHVTERVSLTSAGIEGDNASSFASLSADGRFVAFQSNARNLVTDDTNTFADVFVHDRQTHVTTRVSVSSEGAQGNNSSVFPSISDDGRYVTFQANASNLVPSDSNNTTDVLLHDRETAQTIRVSVSSAGVAGNGASNDPKISNDGHYIVFTSLANTLVAGDTNAVSDIFVYDRLSARTVRVNLAPSGAQADAASTKPVISSGGRLVAFLSRASNLLPGANGLDQIYMVFFNDQPTITEIADAIIDEDGTTGALEFTVNDVKTDLESLIVSATSDNGSLVPAESIVLGGNSGARTITITPATNTSGAATITVVVSDGSLSSSNSFVVTVNAVNDAPVALANSATVAEDTLLTVNAPGVLANDSDTENSALTAVLVSGPTNGALTLNLDGGFTYLPATNFHGTDAFTYAANDGGSNSAPATVTITVDAVNDIPIADTQAVFTMEDETSEIILAAGDVDGDALTFSVVNLPLHGTLSGLAPNLVYTPATNFFGEDSFTFMVNDGTGDSAPATVFILLKEVNDAPLASNDNYATDEELALTVIAPGVLANDSDVEGSALTAALISGPAHGTLTLNPNGGFSYVPNFDFFGTDTFTYHANDGALDSVPAIVSLTVNNIPDAPIATNDVYTLNEDTVFVLDAPGVLTNDFDADFDVLNAVLVVGPSHGVLELNEDGSFTYTPETNFFGADGFTYLANDGFSDSEPVDVVLTVNPVNDAPFALAKNYATLEDITLTVPAESGLLAGASDVENEALTAVLATAPSHGLVTLAPDGSFTYVPAPDFNGVDGFSYKASDGTDLGAETAVTIAVAAVNDAPVVAAEISAQNGVYGTAFSFTFDAAAFADVDGDALAYSASGLPPGLSFDAATRTFSGTPTLASNYTVQVVANDGQAPALTASNQFIFAIAKAPLTITADNKSRAFGAENPELTMTYAGFVLGDDTNVLDSLPGMATAATSLDGVGAYPITITGGSDDNYEFTFVNGTLTVTAGDAPVITLTLLPGFYTIGTDAILIDTNALVSDAASLDLNGGILTVTVASNNAVSDLLALATNAVIGLGSNTVSFEGVPIGTLTGGSGANALVFMLNTNATPAIVQSLVQQLTFETEDTNTASRGIEFVLTDGDGGTSASALRVLELNRPPVAQDDLVRASEGVAARIAISLLFTNDFDVDGDSISLSGNSAVSVQGGGVTISGTNFIYRAPTNFVGEDMFAYLIEDGRGGESIAVVTVNVLARGRLILDVSNLGAAGSEAGAVVVFGAMPDQAYEIQVSDDLETWSVLATGTASPTGVIEVLDAAAKDAPKRFYRALLH